MPYPALIFDFDGTIADTLAEGVRIYNELAEEYALRLVSETEIPDLRDLTTKALMSHLGIRRSKVPVLLTKGRRRLQLRLAPRHGLQELIGIGHRVGNANRGDK